jgi:hypothetical protein
MTAIASAYTPEGFVIGADGQRQSNNTGETISLTAQKIFPVRLGSFVGAYAWAGVAQIWYPDKTFSFPLESQIAIRDIFDTPPTSPYEFVHRLIDRLYKRLIECNGSMIVVNPHSLPDAEIIRVLCVGYADRTTPVRVQAVFSHTAGVLFHPNIIEHVSAPNDFNIFSGSEKVWDGFKYSLARPLTLVEGSTAVREYIQTCINNADQYPDCVGMGGRIHIGTVTADQFVWVDPPL